MGVRGPWSGRETVQREGLAEAGLGEVSGEGRRTQLPTSEEDEGQNRHEEQREVPPCIDGRIVGEEAGGRCQRRPRCVRGRVGEG